jgi:hypothetical protein
MRLKVIRLLPLLCLSPLAGCVGLTAAQSDATLKFASAATALGNASSIELTKMHDETITMNIAMYRLPDLPADSNPVNPSTGQRESIIATEIRNAEYEKLAGRFAGNWYEVFTSGPQALKAYGQALTEIVNANNTAQVKQSSDSLAAALKAIPNSPVSSATQSAVTALSQQLTEWALARMKAHAIHSIVVKYNDDVGTVCKVIGDNFVIVPAGQHQPNNFAEAFQAVAQTLEASSKTTMDLHPTDRIIRSDGLASWLSANQNLNEVKTAFPQIVKSSAGCASANAALVAALNDNVPSIKDIEDFYAGAQQLRSTINTLGSK